MSELRDIFGTGVSVPVISYTDMTKGTTVRGVLVEPHRTLPVINLETNKPETWDNGDPKTKGELTLAGTGLTGWEHCSDTFKEKVPEDEVDTGMRRLMVGGAAVKPFREAIRAAKLGGLPVGCWISVRFDGKKSVAGQIYKSNILAFRIEAADATSTKVLQEHQAAKAPAAGPGDPWSTGADDEDETPPF